MFTKDVASRADKEDLRSGWFFAAQRLQAARRMVCHSLRLVFFWFSSAILNKQATHLERWIGSAFQPAHSLKGGHGWFISGSFKLSPWEPASFSLPRKFEKKAFRRFGKTCAS